MLRKTIVAALIICFFTVHICSSAENPNEAYSKGSAKTVELVRYEDEYSLVRVEPAQMDGEKGLAVVFEGSEDLHYYANRQNAPGGYNLKVKAESPDFSFGKPVFPKWTAFFDKDQNKTVEVYVGSFTVFVPLELIKEPTKTATIERPDAEITISGLACTSKICLSPFEKTLTTKINLSQAQVWQEISFEKRTVAEQPIEQWANYSLWTALMLALLAGLILNVMPCVWPVLPIIIMRIVEQAKESKAKSASMGLAFCFGILLFFACLAVANIILHLFYGTALQWGEQFRNPVIVAGMALLLVVLALFMFDVFTITVPSSISSKSSTGKGYTGAVGMGFLAAVLSTPCSFGILAAAFAWAQSQPLSLGTLAIMVIGIGMACPYAVLTSMPGLLNRLPKAGRWMEIFKQAVGFILLFIAIKLISAYPQEGRTGLLYFAVVLGFCVWMWSSWVRFNTKLSRKLIVRVCAILLLIGAGFFLHSPKRVDWQPYNETLIEQTKTQGKPVLIDFTADWCLNCEVVNRVVYQRKDIAGLISEKGVLPIKADTTIKGYPATVALKNVYNEPGVPVSILFIPGNEEPLRWHGVFFADELKRALEQLPSR